MKKLIIGFLILVVFFSCKLPEEETGMSLIKTYTGVMTHEVTQTIYVPEIKGKMGSTYVLAYGAFQSSHDIWTPIMDGWLDASEQQMFWVSWEFGSVHIYNGYADYYMIHVYGEK